MKSAATGMPIVTLSETSARYIIDDANRIGVNIPEPVVATKLVNNRSYYRGVRYRNGFLVDEVDLILQYLLNLGCPVNTATLTPDSMKNEKRGEMIMNDKEEYIRNYKAYWGTIAFGVDAHSHIKRIKIIVPDKVVEITFLDGGKEKMVCHKEDTFDLRKCCFIAIAKHLYKNTYTFEGVEYKANELMMQKKYVKIVNDALKNFRSKEREREKEERIAKERKEAIERRKAKRFAQKERRTQRKVEEKREALKRERDEMISIITDAIVKANSGDE